MKKDETTKVPRVLLNAKAQVGQEKANGAYDKGPWDKGHWANRK